jgi:2'-5' RNA ligase
MRMFVALVPPPEALEDLAEFLAPRQEAGGDFRWTAPEQWHVTLAFLPQVPDRRLDDLVARLERAAGRRTRFDVRICGAGAFPNPARAKVLYAAVETTAGAEAGPEAGPGAGAGAGTAREELNRLATGARAAANKAGAEADGGRFHPHLTLARLRNPGEVTRWIRVLDAYRGPRWPAEEISLIASHLGEGPRRRPRYELVDTFPLRAG